MSVELIITQGSIAGSPAPIHQGYYLVGRLPECQIRPKSKSVSRRHCLLLHNKDGFGALDLKSTRGTHVNGTRLEPHRWCVLNDGDEIRFGKVAFSVSIKQPALAANRPADHPRENANTETDESSPETAPKSWHNIDVAGFLQQEDAAEFAEKYGLDPEGLAGGENVSDIAIADEDSVDVFDDADLDDGSPLDTFVGKSAIHGDGSESESEKEVEVDPAPRKRPPRRKIDHKAYKRASRRSFSLPSWLSVSGDGATWKLIGAVAFLAVTLGVFYFQFQSFTSGPTLEVREELD